MTTRDVAIRAARSAGEIVRGYFGQPLEVRYKTRKDLVTQADVESDSAIVGVLRSNFPDHNIFSEESPRHDAASPYEWLVDPLDGTTNFAAGIPWIATSIALCYNRQPVLAVVYDMLRDEMFWAERGQGAYLNRQPIHVGPKSAIEDCVVSYGRSYHPPDLVGIGTRVYGLLLPRVRALRQLGGCALDFCYVASGRLDATITVSMEAEPKLEHPGGCLLVEEAGGTASDFVGRAWHRDSTTVIAGNAELHRRLLDVLGA